jgi:hypothetical protein
MAGAANAEVLISAEEASRPAPKDTRMATRSVGRPPSVTMESEYKPEQAKPQKSPVNLSLKFVAHGGAKIDVSTVRVVYLREPEVDLTPRLKKFISASGINMPGAEVPPGEHLIRIDLKDTGGRDAPPALIKLIITPGGGS